MQIRAILFDWGGTLASVDGQTDALLRGAAEVLRQLIGRAEADLVRSMMLAAVQAEENASVHPEFREVDLGELLGEWAQTHAIAIDASQLQTALATLGRNWVGSALTLLPGVRQTLQTLRSMGLPMGLVSNCYLPPRYCWDELRQQGIADLLDFAVFSSEVGYRKPSRRIYAEALRQLRGAGGPEDCGEVIFVGDSPAYDVITPSALGMKTALVSSTSGIWSAEDYERARPDFRIDSVIELPALLADLS